MNLSDVVCAVDMNKLFILSLGVGIVVAWQPSYILHELRAEGWSN